MSAPIRAADPAAVEEAARTLRAGGLVAFPTETVYGLGADATSDRAVARIFEAKGRPEFNPLIVHGDTASILMRLVRFTSRAASLAGMFWPGPLTLVLARTDDCPISRLASAGLPTLAVRVPKHPVALALIAATGRPLAAPSANRSGALSPTTAAHVATSLGDRIDMILDGGACPVGVESTIVDLTVDPPILLRPGGVAREAIERVIGPLVAGPSEVAVEAGLLPKAPGQLRSHYAPRLPVRLDVTAPRPDEAYLAFGPDVPPGAAEMHNLSPAGDLVEAAANLFGLLHALDDARFAGIAVAPIPDHGLGAAINDRLRRAAADRTR
ncbi:MAG: L-threonylcarbamoyladenylate synthase [Alphaproteobacteria bacterium]